MGLPMMPPGAPPPMAGMGAPGLGPNPMGGPNPAAIQALDQLAQMPLLDAIKTALQEGLGSLQAALGKIQAVSPKAATHVAKALGEITRAQELVASEGAQPVAPPPDLLGAMRPAPMGTPSMGPLG